MRHHRHTCVKKSGPRLITFSSSLAMVSARQLVGQGMQSFRSGKVEESIDYFNEAESAEPSITPFLWQRGLSYYYADQFDDASKQFRADVRVNPADAEEIVWDIASQLRMQPAKFPVPNQLTLPRKDSRRIMVSLSHNKRDKHSHIVPLRSPLSIDCSEEKGARRISRLRDTRDRTCYLDFVG